MSRTMLVQLLALGFLSAPLAGQSDKSPHGELPEGLDCAACHTARGWTPLRSPVLFTHGARGGFLVTGAHEQAPCAGCHTSLRFDGPEVAMNDCAGCHLDVHQGAMRQPCASCHDTRSFNDVDGEAIHARTALPLTGAHRQISCERCHLDDRGGAFAPLDPTCASCHMPDFQAARTVDHQGGGYPTDCTRCHSTMAWADTPAFDHAAVSGGFDLRGAHQDLRCASCHAVPGMDPLFQASGPEDCAGCHQDDFDRRHGGTRIPDDCLVCHTVDDWEVENFDHGLTGFSLVGRHAGMNCSACHVEGGPGLRFPRPSQQDDCVACHAADYEGEHAGSGFPTTCLSCHNPSSWDAASFNHASTAFPLLGAHQAATCAACHGPPAHLSASFAGPDDCVACHQTEYDREHAGSAFPTTCLSCHSMERWDGAVFDHAGQAGFPLDGPHAVAPCASCHTLPDYGLAVPKPADADDCVACHQADYDREHAGSPFPDTCLSCHARDRWEGATFDHGVSTGFALEAPHETLACASCHAVPGYALLFPPPAGESDCVACHQGDYDREHAGSGFPTTCLSCHRSDAWTGATFDHVTASSGFDLLGAHATTPCAGCHVVPGYALTFPRPSGPSDCVACHQTDYDAAHASQGFPTACASCHNATAWEPSTFDHDRQYFPINTGAHRGEWSQCADCHPNPGDIKVFSCLNCHEHRQTEMDDVHRGRQGYAYVSAACLSCHPTGRAD